MKNKKIMKKESRIKVIEKHEIDVIYNKGENIEDLKKKLLASGYKQEYHIEAEKDERNNTFFTKKVVIES